MATEPKRRPRAGVDARDLIGDAARGLDGSTRRRFLARVTSLGAMAALVGCDVIDGPSAEEALRRVSEWNDRVQAWLFDPERMAETYPESAIDDPFPFNAFYGPEQAPTIAEAGYELYVEGLVADKSRWRLDALRALPQTSQVTRHICIEGWSAVGKWSGTPLRTFLERIGADLSARYVAFLCADRYETSLDMATALHPQTLMAFGFGDGVLPRQYGFPMKIRVPTKLGFKNPKHVVQLTVTNDPIDGFWEREGYNWFSGL
ncbi:MAG: molybdopterin-dependent oxidoreductase [Alphaproteobacteria bacterium]